MKLEIDLSVLTPEACAEVLAVVAQITGADTTAQKRKARPKATKVVGQKAADVPAPESETVIKPEPVAEDDNTENDNEPVEDEAKTPLPPVVDNIADAPATAENEKEDEGYAGLRTELAQLSTALVTSGNGGKLQEVLASVDAKNLSSIQPQYLGDVVAQLRVLAA